MLRCFTGPTHASSANDDDASSANDDDALSVSVASVHERNWWDIGYGRTPDLTSGTHSEESRSQVSDSIRRIPTTKSCESDNTFESFGPLGVLSALGPVDSTDRSSVWSGDDAPSSKSESRYSVSTGMSSPQDDSLCSKDRSESVVDAPSTGNISVLNSHSTFTHPSDRSYSGSSRSRSQTLSGSSQTTDKLDSECTLSGGGSTDVTSFRHGKTSERILQVQNVWSGDATLSNKSQEAEHSMTLTPTSNDATCDDEGRQQHTGQEERPTLLSKFRRKKDNKRQQLHTPNASSVTRKGSVPNDSVQIRRHAADNANKERDSKCETRTPSPQRVGRLRLKIVHEIVQGDMDVLDKLVLAPNGASHEAVLGDEGFHKTTTKASSGIVCGKGKHREKLDKNSSSDKILPITGEGDHRAVYSTSPSSVYENGKDYETLDKDQVSDSHGVLSTEEESVDQEDVLISRWKVDSSSSNIEYEDECIPSDPLGNQTGNLRRDFSREKVKENTDDSYISILTGKKATHPVQWRWQENNDSLRNDKVPMNTRQSPRHAHAPELSVANSVGEEKGYDLSQLSSSSKESSYQNGKSRETSSMTRSKDEGSIRQFPFLFSFSDIARKDIESVALAATENSLCTRGTAFSEDSGPPAGLAKASPVGACIKFCDKTRREHVSSTTYTSEVLVGSGSVDDFIMKDVQLDSSRDSAALLKKMRNGEKVIRDEGIHGNDYKSLVDTGSSVVSLSLPDTKSNDLSMHSNALQGIEATLRAEKPYLVSDQDENYSQVEPKKVSVQDENYSQVEPKKGKSRLSGMFSRKAVSRKKMNEHLLYIPSETDGDLLDAGEKKPLVPSRSAALSSANIVQESPKTDVRSTPSVNTMPGHTVEETNSSAPCMSMMSVEIGEYTAEPVSSTGFPMKDLKPPIIMTQVVSSTNVEILRTPTSKAPSPVEVAPSQEIEVHSSLATLDLDRGEAAAIKASFSEPLAPTATILPPAQAKQHEISVAPFLATAGFDKTLPAIPKISSKKNASAAPNAQGTNLFSKLSRLMSSSKPAERESIIATGAAEEAVHSVGKATTSEKNAPDTVSCLLSEKHTVSESSKTKPEACESISRSSHTTESNEGEAIEFPLFTGFLNDPKNESFSVDRKESNTTESNNGEGKTELSNPKPLSSSGHSKLTSLMSPVKEPLASKASILPPGQAEQQEISVPPSVATAGFNKTLPTIAPSAQGIDLFSKVVEDPVFEIIEGDRSCWPLLIPDTPTEINATGPSETSVTVGSTKFMTTIKSLTPACMEKAAPADTTPKPAENKSPEDSLCRIAERDGCWPLLVPDIPTEAHVMALGDTPATAGSTRVMTTKKSLTPSPMEKAAPVDTATGQDETKSPVKFVSMPKLSVASASLGSVPSHAATANGRKTRTKPRSTTAPKRAQTIPNADSSSRTGWIGLRSPGDSKSQFTRETPKSHKLRTDATKGGEALRPKKTSTKDFSTKSATTSAASSTVLRGGSSCARGASTSVSHKAKKKSSVKLVVTELATDAIVMTHTFSDKDGGKEETFGRPPRATSDTGAHKKNSKCRKQVPLHSDDNKPSNLSKNMANHTSSLKGTAPDMREKKGRKSRFTYPWKSSKAFTVRNTPDNDEPEEASSTTSCPKNEGISPSETPSHTLTGSGKSTEDARKVEVADTSKLNFWVEPAGYTSTALTPVAPEDAMGTIDAVETVSNSDSVTHNKNAECQKQVSLNCKDEKPNTPSMNMAKDTSVSKDTMSEMSNTSAWKPRNRKASTLRTSLDDELAGASATTLSPKNEGISPSEIPSNALTGLGKSTEDIPKVEVADTSKLNCCVEAAGCISTALTLLASDDSMGIVAAVTTPNCRVNKRLAALTLAKKNHVLHSEGRFARAAGALLEKDRTDSLAKKIEFPPTDQRTARAASSPATPLEVEGRNRGKNSLVSAGTSTRGSQVIVVVYDSNKGMGEKNGADNAKVKCDVRRSVKSDPKKSVVVYSPREKRVNSHRHKGKTKHAESLRKAGAAKQDDRTSTRSMEKNDADSDFFYNEVPHEPAADVLDRIAHFFNLDAAQEPAVNALDMSKDQYRAPANCIGNRVTATTEARNDAEEPRDIVALSPSDDDSFWS